jgi:hypothetical protein
LVQNEILPRPPFACQLSALHCSDETLHIHDKPANKKPHDGWARQGEHLVSEGIRHQGQFVAEIIVREHELVSGIMRDGTH